MSHRGADAAVPCHDAAGEQSRQQTAGHAAAVQVLHAPRLEIFSPVLQLSQRAWGADVTGKGPAGGDLCPLPSSGRCASRLPEPGLRPKQQVQLAHFADLPLHCQDNPFADMGKLMENVKKAQELVKTEGARVQEELAKYA